MKSIIYWPKFYIARNYSNLIHYNTVSGHETKSCTPSTQRELYEISPNINDSATVYASSINSVVAITIQSQNGRLYGGSGFFASFPNSSNYNFSSFGYILTAGHVITDPRTNQICSTIYVHTSYPANSSYNINISGDILGIDKVADIALLQLPGSHFQHINSKDSRSELQIGDSVNIIGYPLLNDIQSITRGIVRDNKYSAENLPESIYTDASIYGGNSGGPVIADDGKAVGILSFGIGNEAALNGAIASHLYIPIAEYFINNYVNSFVSYPKGYLGINYNEITPFYPMIYPNVKVEGYRIKGFDPLVSKQFNMFDIITEVEGNRIGIMNDQTPFFTEIHLRHPGSAVSIKYLPYISSNKSYLSENNTTVILSEFNPKNDVFPGSILQIPFELDQ